MPLMTPEVVEAPAEDLKEKKPGHVSLLNTLNQTPG
jgi:hypothetical protein